MGNNTEQREEGYKRRLMEELKRQYGIHPLRIVPAKRGFYGETWNVRGEEGSWFLKMDFLPFHQKRFQNSLTVMEYLCANGIDFIGTIIRTKDNQLSGRFDTAIMGLFEWVDGENVETNETKKPEYELLCNIYRLTRPGLPIPSAEFSDAAAVRFYKQWELLRQASGTDANLAVLSVLERFRGRIAHSASRLSELSRLCRRENCPLFLTHGDAGGNFFVRAGGGKAYLFDWDEVMYAPLERDAWVMGCFDWARKLFDDTLRAYNISYQLRRERLAFYCYHMDFFYLGEMLMKHQLCDTSEKIRKYLENGWTRSRMEFADTI